MLEIFIFLQKLVNLECETQHAFITHANTANGIKILILGGKSWGMMLFLSNAPLIGHYWKKKSSKLFFLLISQVALFNSIRPLFANKPLIIACNKIDITSMDELGAAEKVCIASPQVVLPHCWFRVQ